MPASQPKRRNDSKTLSDALRIAEKAFRISVITAADPFAAVQEAAAEMWLAETEAHEMVLEALSEAGTVSKGRKGGQEFLYAAVEHLKESAKHGR